MDRKRWPVLLFLCLLLVVCPSKDKGKAIQSGGPEDFTLTSLDGDDFTLSKLKGKVILIDFWATWCPPCVRSIPVFIKFYNKYHDQGFLVLGISREDVSILKRYRDEHGVSYPILIDDKNIAKEYGVRYIPNMFIIDKKGRIRKTQVGFAPEIEPMLEALIDSLLKE